MDYFMQPVDIVGKVWQDSPAFLSRDPNKVRNASEQFSSVFLRTMLKEVFKGQADPFSGQAENPMAGYSRIVADAMIDQLAHDDVFGFNKIVENEIKQKNLADPGGIK